MRGYIKGTPQVKKIVSVKGHKCVRCKIHKPDMVQHDLTNRHRNETYDISK